VPAGPLCWDRSLPAGDRRGDLDPPSHHSPVFSHDCWEISCPKKFQIANQRVSRLRTAVNEGKARETVSNRPKRGSKMSILKKLRERTRPLGVKEIAELFDVSEATIQRWVRRGEIPAIRVSDTIRFDPGVLADWIEQRSIVSGEPDAEAGQAEDANA